MSSGRARDASTVRRVLFDSDLLRIGHVTVRPLGSACGELEVAEHHALALPLAGVFAKHDGPREQAIATPSHALLITAGKPYRLSFPGGIGDRCLVLRFTGEALARVAPEALDGDGFDPSRFAAHTLLPPRLMLARSRLLQCLLRGEIDPLEAEERGVGLLDAVLCVARRPPARTSVGRRAGGGGSRRRQRAVQLAVEAIATDPGRRWTLDALARHASLSPYHLARVFRAEMGITVYGYVLRSRLAGALEAVLDSDAGLIQVALDAGFASHSHFSARFRALFGHTPQELRRNVRGGTVRQLRRIATASEPALV